VWCGNEPVSSSSLAVEPGIIPQSPNGCRAVVCARVVYIESLPDGQEQLGVVNKAESPDPSQSHWPSDIYLGGGSEPETRRCRETSSGGHTVTPQSSLSERNPLRELAPSWKQSGAVISILGASLRQFPCLRLEQCWGNSFPSLTWEERGEECRLKETCCPRGERCGLDKVGG
jgi:hypothetical protein